MDFTREPIVQTVITPKEGCKIVVRSSKNSGQEEYFVDAVEVVSFGSAIFFRSVERPKSFLVPASDYEVLEVREARMVLKNVGVDRAIKIGGGRDATVRGGRDHSYDKPELVPDVEAEGLSEAPKVEVKPEGRVDKKRDRRRNSRRRRGRDDVTSKEGEEEGDAPEGSERIELPKPITSELSGSESLPLISVLTSLLPPPATLISETIARYRDNASFKSVFFTKEATEASVLESSSAEAPAQGQGESIHPPTVALEQPEFGSFEMSEEEQEEIYQQRHLHEEKAHPDMHVDSEAPASEEVVDEEACQVEENLLSSEEPTSEELNPDEAHSDEQHSEEQQLSSEPVEAHEKPKHLQE